MKAGRIDFLGAVAALFAYAGGGTGAQPEQLDPQRDVVDAFNASHDDIHLDLEVFDIELAYEELRSRIAAGNAPDIIGPVGIRGSVEFAGAFLDLGPYVHDEVLDDYSDAQLAVWEDDDGLTALPFGVFPSMLFVNTELFARAGLTIPPATFGATHDGGNAVIPAPWRSDLRSTFLEDLARRFGDGVRWDVIDEALTQPDVPSHEAGLPDPERSQRLLDAQHRRIRTDPDPDVAAAAEALRIDLQVIFSRG